MDRLWLEEWKRRIPLLDYLQSQNWRPCRRSSGGQVGGLCPLHLETRPSFWIHPGKNLFYCHGCGVGGDIIRLVERWHHLSFPDALAHLRAWLGSPDLLSETAAFYRAQLPHYPQATAYLEARGIHDPDTIAELGIGYAPGACLRAHLRQHGFAAGPMHAAGLIDARGRDSWFRRIVFPCGVNLYGRSLDDRGAHRFLSGSKGGLYRWEHLAASEDVVLVEGMFDVAALWQAGFRRVTCGWGTHLNRLQYEQLARGEPTVWVAFDGDAAGQHAAHRLVERLRGEDRTALRVTLPEGHDPASYFAAGATAVDFQHLLDEARP
jgi:DNA primase